jgi:hypothetical protein
MSYRDSASFGKRQEFVVIAELLKRNYDVYLTLVDDQGIDCLIRKSSNRYLDIQIKARSKKAIHSHTFAGLKFSVRKNYFFIFYTEIDNNYWIIPSSAVKRFGRKNKSGKNKGKVTIIMPHRTYGKVFERFKKYNGEEGFKFLKRK